MVAATNFAPNTAAQVVQRGPANPITEVVQAARANPGKLAYGTNGLGGTYHLDMALLSQKFGIELIHVPYKSGVDALMAATTATLPIAYAPCASAFPQVKAGKLKIIAALEKSRLPELPDLPAMGEWIPDYEKVASGVDLYGPAGLPQAIASRIASDWQKAIATPEV